MGEIVIDANQLDKSVRKDTVVQTFDSLKAGDRLILRHNIDPLPLKKVFDSCYPGRFTWNYIKSGPEVWEIRIIKVFRDDYTINELIESYPQSIFVFEKYQVEYFLKGREKLITCINAKYDIRVILKEVFDNDLLRYKFALPRFQSWSIELIIEYILQNHHSYVGKALPEIENLIHKIAAQHGQDHPEFQFFSERFLEFKEDLSEHMQEEEDVLFPRIIELIKSGAKNKNNLSVDINWMIEDHVLVGCSLRSLRSICNQYSEGEIDLPAYPALMNEMIQFEKDFHIHLHIENNILFPKVLTIFS